MLSSIHVAVERSKIRRDSTELLFAKPGGATGLYLPHVHGVEPVNAVPTLVASFLANFEALRERKAAYYARWGSTKDQTAPEG